MAVSKTALLREQITMAERNATPEDRRLAEEITARAKAAVYECHVYRVTPGVAAIVFNRFNCGNRNWLYQKTVDFATAMRTNEWLEHNHQMIQFCPDGDLGDGQHRLAAIVLSGMTIEVEIGYGVSREHMQTVDAGTVRFGRDHAKIAGISNSVIKETIVKMYAAYHTKLGDEDARLYSSRKVSNEITRNDTDLNRAIQIATETIVGVSKPVLSRPLTRAVAYILLKYQWPADELQERLAQFQRGQVVLSQSEPNFVIAVRLQTDPTRSRPRLNNVEKIAYTIYALRSTAQGVARLTVTRAKRDIDISYPDPTYIN